MFRGTSAQPPSQAHLVLSVPKHLKYTPKQVSKVEIGDRGEEARKLEERQDHPKDQQTEELEDRADRNANLTEPGSYGQSWMGFSLNRNSFQPLEQV